MKGQKLDRRWEQHICDTDQRTLMANFKPPGSSHSLPDNDVDMDSIIGWRYDLEPIVTNG